MKISFLIILLFSVISVLFFSICYCQIDDQQSLVEVSLSGVVQIDSFKINSRMTGRINFFIDSNETITSVIFLPATIGSWWDVSHYTQTEYGFQPIFIEDKFNGSCISNGYFFPWDDYELTFILGFDRDVLIKSDTITSYFGDAQLYTDWQIREESSTSLGEDQIINSDCVDKIAVGQEDFNRIKNDYNLTSFHIIKARISRQGVNFSRSLLVWFAPGTILFVILTYWLKAENKTLGDSIRLYTGISFFLTAYLFTIREIIPPILTIIELVILMEITGCLMLLIFHPKIYSPSNKVLSVTGSILLILGALISIFNGLINGLSLLVIGVLFIIFFIRNWRGS